MTDRSPTPERRVTRRRILRASAATAAAATVPATAAAQDGDGDRGVLERIAIVRASLRGWRAGLLERTLGDTSDAETAALEAKDEFNAHSDEWTAYINDHAETNGEEAIEVIFAPDPEEGEVYTVYLVGEYNSENEAYEWVEIVEQTDRTIDETARLESIAAENAADEIATGYEKFVAENEPPSDGHLAYLAGKYRFGTEHVTSTLLGDDI